METKYRCTQDELYEGAELLAASLEEDLGAFSFKAKYDAAFITAFRGVIDDARNLPDDAQRTADAETRRINLRNLTDGDVRDALGALRLYIRDAAPNEELRAVAMGEAGYDYYEEAMSYNWERLKGLLKNANDFITNHLADLTANNNMPAGFALTFQTLKDDVDSQVTIMLNSRENSRLGTYDKIVANNELYDQCIAICGDGQHVFADNEAKRSQFVWESVMAIISPPGAAGLRIDIKEEGTNMPVEDATITIQLEGGVPITLVTDADGKVYFQNLTAGQYTGTISKADYETKSSSGEIKTGVTSFVHGTLVKTP